MKNLGYLVIPLRILIVMFFVGLLVGQGMSIPGQFSHMAAEAPELGFVPWGLLIFSLLEVACLQAVLVCLWQLLSRVSANRIFSDSSFAWVNGIVWATSIGWGLLIVAFVGISTFLYFTPRLRDPGLPILLFGLVLVGGVVVLTVAVLRALLRQATTLRSELEEVI